MRRRLLTLAIAALGLGAVGSLAAYGYDTSRDDLIAEGVSVGDVDLGGKRTEEAKTTLRLQLEPSLEEPVLVSYRGRKFRLSAKRARLELAIDRIVKGALRESREGNVVTRTFRDLTGGSAEADLPVRVGYSKSSLASFVQEVKESVDRPARDATVKPAGAGLRKVASREGLSVQPRRLTRMIAATLARPAGRVVEAPVRIKKPRVTTAELADRYATFLTVDRGSFRLRLFKRLKLARTYRIGVGRVGFETPVGLYRIQNKAVNPSWFVPDKPWAGDLAGKVIPPGPDNPIKSRWLGIYDGAGIHGTADVGSIGTPASHGCIRMLITEVEQLYDRVPVGASVYIG